MCGRGRLLLGLFERGEFAQGLREHRKHARITLAFERRGRFLEQAILYFLHLRIGRTPHALDQRRAIARRLGRVRSLDGAGLRARRRFVLWSSDHGCSPVTEQVAGAMK